MQTMKQLARSAVYWPHIDSQIEDRSRCCTACAEHQNKPPQLVNHPWMMTEKPWSRILINHLINFMGSNWLIITNAYSKFPFIYQTSPISTNCNQHAFEKRLCSLWISTPSYMYLPTLQLSVLQSSRNCVITEAYYLTTNGAAERLVQSLKQPQKISKLPLIPTLQDCLMQCRRMSLDTGFSPSQLLNGR